VSEPGTTLGIVRLSSSFEVVWGTLAEELGVRLVSTELPVTWERSPAAVIVAAGGEEGRGLDLLSGFPADDHVPVFLVGSQVSHRFAVSALRAGAADYFALPGDLDLLRRTLASRIQAAPPEVERPAAGSAFSELVGSSPAMVDTFERAGRVALHGDVTILIGGETGTGKELLSRAIHERSPRSGGPFVAVNCAAIPATLLESELFGHEKGAFTDAHRAKAGLFEEANGGTLLLDEIAQLSLPLQGKLLRALEERRIRRVGAVTDRAIDVRIMAATHVDLEGAVARGDFREDLYYRLKVVTLTLPPLRDRGNDVLSLARHFLRLLAKRYGMPEPALSPQFTEELRAHRWPGNIRELRHAIERALVLSPPGSLDPGELGLQRADELGRTGSGLTFPATLQELNRAAAHEAVRISVGNKSAAARLLGISRARLQRLLDADVEDDVR